MGHCVMETETDSNYGAQEALASLSLVLAVIRMSVGAVLTFGGTGLPHHQMKTGREKARMAAGNHVYSSRTVNAESTLSLYHAQVTAGGAALKFGLQKKDLRSGSTLELILTATMSE